MIGDGVRVGAFLASFFAAAGILAAFLPLWLSDRGFSAALIGNVLGAASLVRVAAVPGWGWVADRLGRHRAALLIAAAVASFSAAALPSTPSVAAIAALIVGGGIAAAALAPLTDAVTLALAGAGRLDYGRTRAWGSVAYMIAIALGGSLLARAGTAAVPWLIAGGYGLAAVLATGLPSDEGVGRVPLSIKAAPLGPAFRATLLASVLIQGSHAAYYAFASLLWRSAGISDSVIGLLIAEGIVAEIALLVWGRGLVEWLGPARLTALAASACLLRWTGLALTTSVPLLALLQLLHAVTFTCQHLSSMSVLRTLPPARAGLAQTLLSSLGFSAPTAILTWISGRLYAGLGGKVFLLMAALGGLALLVAPRLPAGRHRSG